MDTRHRGSETGAGRRLGWILALALSGTLAAAVAAASDVPAAVEPGLGASEEALREHFGEALRIVAVERRPTLAERIGAGAKAPEGAKPPEGTEAAARAGEPRTPDFPGQTRLRREVASDDVSYVEYDLHAGRVYRVRQRLASRFERPIVSDLVVSLTSRLGAPTYDQTLEAKPATGRAELRRIGWRRDGEALEVRQIHPLTGGPLYVTRTDLAAAQALVDAGVSSLPQPDSSVPWWRRPGPPSARVEVLIPTPAERAELLAALALSLDSQGW